MNIDISIVLNAHSEGLLAHAACDSLDQARRLAEAQGVRVEVVAVLDRATDDTAAFFAERAGADWRILILDVGDVGKARNAGVQAARGRWIAFLDADDLFGKDWLLRAYTAGEADSRLVVWHPELNIYFGGDQHVFRHVDMEDADFRPEDVLCRNHWTALCFAPKALLIAIPYPSSALISQLGYEDWSWNLETMASGAMHKIVPRTGHLIRVRPNSLNRRTNASRSIPVPPRTGAMLPRFNGSFE